MFSLQSYHFSDNPQYSLIADDFTVLVGHCVPVVPQPNGKERLRYMAVFLIHTLNRQAVLQNEFMQKILAVILVVERIAISVNQLCDLEI